MAVYVDELVWESRGRMWCHLLSDSDAELHRFAVRLGLPRSAFHSRPGRPWRDHYDVPDELRAGAVRLGAREITFHEAGGHIVRRRQALFADRMGTKI
jgi:hypothetical protein